jgi:hypothetical protein
MFDAHSNVAQNLDAMLARSSQDQRQRVMQQMAQAQAPQAPQNPQAPQMPQPMQTQQAYQQPQNYQRPPQQLSQTVSYSQGPQLPAPVMSPMSPPTPPVPNAYTSPQTYQQPPTIANNLGVPSMQPTNQPSNQNGQNNFWFANGPGYPGSPTPGQTPPAAAPAPTPAVQQQPQQPAPLPAPQPDNSAASTIPEPYAEAISSGKISTDVPIAAAATPTDDELAFAEAARKQQELERQRYNHVRVVDPATGSVTTPQPSVPGMIDYGRPQPTDDQMQYDTSMPQSSSSQAQPPSQPGPVTRTPDPAILDLAKNDDLDVATIARQVGKDLGKGPGEVEVKLR